ncbi:NAD(+) synthase [Candidatus Fermentibacteria bacterium]|nr:NAD(+) synthase [Candidatus Fermentibacteria bacterium]
MDYKVLAAAIQRWITRVVEEAGRLGVVLGLSGGLDSGVGAALSAGALGPERVLALSMPCGGDPDDVADARRLADVLGLELKPIDLSPVLKALVEVGGAPASDTMALANAKARMRMVTLYAHSEGRLVQGTSNLSELSVGYWTKWGDGAADFLPQAGLYKDEVRQLAEALDLPRWLVDREPSAGLWEGQTDEGEMGVSYRQIRCFFDPAYAREHPGALTPEAADKIENLVARNRHKMEPIPGFDARGWISENG